MTTKSYYVQYDWKNFPDHWVCSWCITNTELDLDTPEGLLAYINVVKKERGTDDLIIRFWKRLKRK